MSERGGGMGGIPPQGTENPIPPRQTKNFCTIPPKEIIFEYVLQKSKKSAAKGGPQTEGFCPPPLRLEKLLPPKKIFETPHPSPSRSDTRSCMLTGQNFTRQKVFPLSPSCQSKTKHFYPGIWFYFYQHWKMIPSLMTTAVLMLLCQGFTLAESKKTMHFHIRDEQNNGSSSEKEK